MLNLVDLLFHRYFKRQLKIETKIASQPLLGHDNVPANVTPAHCSRCGLPAEESSASTYILIMLHTLEARLAGVARVGCVHALEARVHTFTSITPCNTCHINGWSAECWSIDKQSYDFLTTLAGEVH